MYDVDPRMLIQAIQNGQNPQQLMISILEQKMGGTPLGDNLLLLAKEGKGADIEKIVRNMYQQNGRNFDAEFSQFKNFLGLK